MIALRIRGLYAAALTQLFHPSEVWEVVQPSEDVRAHIDHTWRMDSPDVDIDDVPDAQGQRDTLRITGSAEATQAILTHLQQHCFDVITRQEHSEVGALYMGLVGILSRIQRQAVVYLGEDRAGILPLRFEDQDLKLGAYVPVRVEEPARGNAGRPQLSKVLTVPGQYAVLTAAPSVKLSKQIVDTEQRDRLQQLGEAQDTGDWGIIWRTAAQDTANDILAQEVQRLAVKAQELKANLAEVTSVGRIYGGELTTFVYVPGYAKAACDTLRTEIRPTLPGHHKYKARGDAYGSTVDALESQLPPTVLHSRTATLSLLASTNAIHQPIEDTLRIMRRTLDGRVLNQGEVQRVADDIQGGWVDVRKPLRNKGHYPRDLNINQQDGDYTLTRFHEGGWHYITRYYSQDNTWQGDYASLTTPMTIFSEHIDLVDLQVAVVRSHQQAPELVGMDALEKRCEQGIVTSALVDKVREEANSVLEQWRQSPH